MPQVTMYCTAVCPYCIRAEALRSYYPAGYARQIAAATMSGDRREKIRRIQAPTIVVHGAADPLVPLAAGRDTADNIPGAELLVIPGMGHDLPPPLFDVFADAIDSAAKRSAARTH